jgi:hypothetical protein
MFPPNKPHVAPISIPLPSVTPVDPLRHSRKPHHKMHMHMKMSVMGTPTGKPVPLATDRPTKKPSSKPFLASTTKPASQSSGGGMKLGGKGMGIGKVPPGPMVLKKGNNRATPIPSGRMNLKGEVDGVMTANKAKPGKAPVTTKGSKHSGGQQGNSLQQVGILQFVGPYVPPENRNNNSSL